jgi:adenine C2-methylase RlmN of 23S rRNA A2503 and tRNA A37
VELLISFFHPFLIYSQFVLLAVMAPKRKQLRIQSIWDEPLVSAILLQSKHRYKLWKHLINSMCSVPRLQRHYDNVAALPFEEWNFPRVSSEKLRSEFVFITSKIVERNESSRGDTTKLLIELQDGHRVETVIMRHSGHATVCVSSQIGCQMGCR